MGRGREVADAYIDVHGDLSKFRNDLNKAKPIVKKVGDEHGKLYNDAFEKRGKAEMADKIKAIFDSAYSRNMFDWDKVFGKFDSKNLDDAQTKLNDFLKDLERRGDITSKQYEELVAASGKARQALKQENSALEEHNRIVTKGATDKRKYAIQRAIQHEKVKTQYKEAKELAKELIEIERDQADKELKAHNRLIAEGKKLRQQAANEHALQTQRSKRAWKELGEEIKRQSMSFEFMSEKFKEQEFEKNWRKLVKFMQDSDLGPNAKSIDAFKKWRSEMGETLKEAKTLGRLAPGEFDKITSKINKARITVRKTNSDVGLLGRSFKRVSGIMTKGADAIKRGWKGMDDDVKVVLALIAAGAGPISAGLSGIAASLTAVASSAALALTSIVPLVSAMSGFGVGIALAVSGMENMKKQFPGIEEAAGRLGDAWTKQANAFGTQWGPAVEGFLNTLGQKINSVDFGTPLGAAFSKITAAFEGVLVSSGFTSFLKAMTTDIPDAVQGFGEGFAGVMNAVMNLLAGAAPAAKRLGELFSIWGGELGVAMEKARESGRMQEVFDLAADSLVVVLDLLGSLGSALGAVFMAGAESGNRLLTSLTGMIDKFTAWTQTVEGKNALEQWFRDGERIIKSFGPLLKGVAGFFDNLVTPYAIDQFTSLMGKVGEFLPMLGNMLNVVSNLGIFNILADALNAVGTAVAPLLPHLSVLATMLGQGISAAIKKLTPLFATIGEALAPIIATFVEVAGDVIPVLVDAFGRISDALSPVIEVIGKVAGVIVSVLAPILGGFLIGIINAAVGFIEGISRAFMGVVNIVKGLLTGDWTMVWEGIKMVVSGVIEAIWNFIQLTLVGKAFGAIKGFLLGAKTLFKGTWTSISTTFNTVLTTIWNFVKTIFTNIGTFITGLFTGISGFFTSIFAAIATVFTTSLSFISDVWSTVWESIVTFVSAVWNNITAVVTGVFTAISEFISSMLSSISEVWSSIWETISSTVSAVWDSIVAFVTSAIENVSNVISSVMDAISTFFSAAWDGIVAGLQVAWDTLVAIVQWGLDLIHSIVFGVLNAVAQFFLGIWDSIYANFSTQIDSIVNFVRESFNNIKTFLTDTWNNIKTFLSDALNNIKTTFSNIWNAIKDVVTNVLDAVKSFISTRLNNIKTNWTNIWNGVKKIASTVWNGIKTVVSNVFNAIKSFISTRLNNIKNNWNNIWNAVKSKVSNVWNGIKTAVSNAINSVRSTISNIMDSIRNTISRIWNRIKSVFSDALNNVKSTVKRGFDKMVSSVRTGISDAVSYVRNLPGKITSALGNLGNLLRGAGRAIMDGLLGGLKRAWGGVKDFVGGVASWISRNKGPISYDRRLLIPAGKAIMQGLGNGLEGMIPNLKGTLNTITDGVVKGFTSKDAQLKKAAEGMGDIMVGALGQSKMVIAGKDAATGFAQGLRANSSAVNGALGKLGTMTSPEASLIVKRPVAGRSSEESAQNAAPAGTVFEDGAIRVQTPATDGKIVAEQLLDEIARKGA